jgi:hypothetical protein
MEGYRHVHAKQDYHTALLKFTNMGKHPSTALGNNIKMQSFSFFLALYT